MRNYEIIKVKTDQGVNKKGASLAPDAIYKKDSFVIESNKEKSIDINDLKKNEDEVNRVNEELYNKVLNILENNKFPITIGGDHSIAIGSALASNNYYDNIGIIWLDSHTDFNTYETTRTGNLHGLPLAAISGYKCLNLRKFANKTINPDNVVVVGARSIDDWEMPNVIDSKIHVFTTNDIKEKGAKKIIEEAIKIASNNTNGVHVSFDMDLIDPIIAPGVSVPEKDGISKEDALLMVNTISKLDNLKSFDLVEYNPLYDKDNITLDIAKEVLNIIKKTQE